MQKNERKITVAEVNLSGKELAEKLFDCFVEIDEIGMGISINNITSPRSYEYRAEFIETWKSLVCKRHKEKEEFSLTEEWIKENISKLTCENAEKAIGIFIFANEMLDINGVEPFMITMDFFENHPFYERFKAMFKASKFGDGRIHVLYMQPERRLK